MAKPGTGAPQFLAGRLMSAFVVTGIMWLILFACMPLINKIPEYLERKHMEPYNAAFASGDMKRVRALFDRDLRGKSEDPAAYLAIADVCLRSNHPGIAIEYLEKSLTPCKDAPRPVRADLYGTLSMCYSSIETTKPQKQAILAAQRASELDPSSPRWLNAYGYLLADNDIQLDEAVQRTSQALQLLRKSPGEDPSLSCMVEDSYGWALYKKGNYDAAVGALNQAIADIPHDAMTSSPLNGETMSTLYYHLGAAARRQGKTDIALQALQTALKHMPGNKDAKAELDDLNSHAPALTTRQGSSKPPAKPNTNNVPKAESGGAKAANEPSINSNEQHKSPAAATTKSPEVSSKPGNANTIAGPSGKQGSAR